MRLAIRALALAAALAALAWGAIGSGSDSGPGEPVMSEAQLEAECRRAIPETERLAREAERETGLPAHGIPEEACDY